MYEVSKYLPYKDLLFAASPNSDSASSTFPFRQRAWPSKKALSERVREVRDKPAVKGRMGKMLMNGSRSLSLSLMNLDYILPRARSITITYRCIATRPARSHSFCWSSAQNTHTRSPPHHRSLASQASTSTSKTLTLTASAIRPCVQRTPLVIITTPVQTALATLWSA